MQVVAPTIRVAPAVGSVVQRVAHIAAPVLVAGAGAAIVFHQRSPLSPSSVTLPRREHRGRMQQLRVVNVEPKGPIGPRWHLKSEEGVIGELGTLSHTIPTLPKKRLSLFSPRAYKDVPYSYRFPAMTKKPKWWWRTLACLPYLMLFNGTWMYYAENAYHLHPFLKDFEFLTEPLLRAIWRLPSWFQMAYHSVAYLGVVKRKEWPRFFRFHVIMAMLLGMALEITGYVSRWMPSAVYWGGYLSRWMPSAVYWGKIAMHFWTAIAFAYLYTVLGCIRCALAGMYADIPFVCDAAYMHILYD